MGALDRALNERPESFNRVGVDVAANVFLGDVVHGGVLVAVHRQPLVGIQFVGRYRGVPVHMLDDVLLKAGPLHVRHNAGDDIATTFHHAEHDDLAKRRPAPLAGALAADHDLVNLDVATDRRVAVNEGEVLADFMTHAPSRLVVHRKLALQFLGRNPVTGRGEQIHGVKPLLQRGVGLVKRGADHGVNMVPARASIGGHLGESFPKISFAAFWALVVLAVAGLEKMFQAGVIIRKELHKFGNRHGLGHGRVSLSAMNIVQ